MEWRYHAYPNKSKSLSEWHWGSSGLHYSANSALLGNGSYLATVTVDTPTFYRELKDKDLWSKPVSAKFHFKLTDGKLTEVSESMR